MHIELFKDAIAIIDGIPDERFRLHLWQAPPNGRVIIFSHEIECGTLACAAGWLSLHPQMQALGLTPDWASGEPLFHHRGGYDALAEFFGISRDDAVNLFGPREFWACDTDDIDVTYARLDRYSDKQLWLKRAHFMLEKYQIKGTT